MGAKQTKFKVIKRLGKGGFGEVYLIQKDNKKYALKKIKEKLNGKDVENITKIIDILSKINNQYIIKYYYSFKEKNLLNIIMEYGGDKNLKQFIDDYKDKSELIQENIILNIIYQLVQGLREIHKNKLIHRDLTPDNIFIDENNGIKIGDFGISKISIETNQYTKSQVGKFNYIAPKIDLGLKYNNKVDIYSLGCIIYELFTLNEYYKDKHYEEKECKIDVQIYDSKWQELIDSLLKKEPDDRPDIETIHNSLSKCEKIKYNALKIQTNQTQDNNDKLNKHQINNDKIEKPIKYEKIIDSVIEKLLSVRGCLPGKQVNLKEEEIKYIIEKSISIIKEEKMLLEIEAPIKICGDIYGQFSELLRIFEHSGYPGDYDYLFLGNYVDFGQQGIEVLCLLLCYKIKYPKKINLLRGNHESSSFNKKNGFYDECKRRYNIKTWKCFTDLFNYLPVATIINDKIFCVHGGLSPELKSLKDIQNISRPTDIPDVGLLCDLLNSDPDKEAVEYDENDKGISVIFGEKVVYDFNKIHDLDLIVRGNQVVDDGYEYFANRQLITIFSATNFRGEYDNSGAILNIDELLTCTLKVLRPPVNLKK